MQAIRLLFATECDFVPVFRVARDLGKPTQTFPEYDVCGKPACESGHFDPAEMASIRGRNDHSKMDLLRIAWGGFQSTLTLGDFSRVVKRRRALP